MPLDVIRFKLFMKSAALNNILAIRVQAVDGNVDDISGADVGATWNSHLNSRFDSSCKADDSLPLSPSERGCAASHIKVWRIIAQFGSSPNIFRSSSVEINAFSLSSLSHQLRVRVRDGNLDNSWFIICEDDAKLVSSSLDANFLGTISKIVALLPLDCDICYLGHTIPRCAQNEIVSVRKAFFRPSYLWQLHAYMIRPTTARVLLSCVPVAEPVDNFLARLIYEKRIVVKFC